MISFPENMPVGSRTIVPRGIGGKDATERSSERSPRTN